MFRQTKIHVTAALAFACALSAACAQELQTREFKAVKDALITREKQGLPGDRTDRNFGKSEFLSADTEYNGDKSHTLIQFDLSSIPANAEIRSAVLVMGPRVQPMTGTIEAIEIRRLLRDDWEEGTHGERHTERSPAYHGRRVATAKPDLCSGRNRARSAGPIATPRRRSCCRETPPSRNWRQAWTSSATCRHGTGTGKRQWVC